MYRLYGVPPAHPLPVLAEVLLEACLFAQRFCGVCTTVNGIASVRTVENAAGIQVPRNAQYIRNLILIAHAL